MLTNRRVVVAAQRDKHRTEALCLQADAESIPAVFAIENVGVFGQAQVVLQRGKSPKTMEQNMAEVRQKIRQHLSLECRCLQNSRSRTCDPRKSIQGNQRTTIGPLVTALLALSE